MSALRERILRDLDELIGLQPAIEAEALDASYAERDPGGPAHDRSQELHRAILAQGPAALPDLEEIGKREDEVGRSARDYARMIAAEAARLGREATLGREIARARLQLDHDDPAAIAASLDGLDREACSRTLEALVLRSPARALAVIAVRERSTPELNLELSTFSRGAIIALVDAACDADSSADPVLRAAIESENTQENTVALALTRRRNRHARARVRACCDPQSVRGRALIERLSRIERLRTSSDEALPLAAGYLRPRDLAPYLASPDPETQRAALRAVSPSARGPSHEIVQPLLDLAIDGEPDIAAAALAILRNDQFVGREVLVLAAIDAGRTEASLALYYRPAAGMRRPPAT